MPGFLVFTGMGLERQVSNVLPVSRGDRGGQAAGEAEGSDAQRLAEAMMLALFTDFGWDGPFVGQMKAVLARGAPAVPVIDLMHDAPTWDPQAAAYLLASLVGEFPSATVFVCVVDPGVGSDERPPVVMRADGRWYVGPGNGILELVRRRACQAELWEIAWRPERLSASFHGRDLFAPVAGWLAAGSLAEGVLRPHSPSVGLDWPDDLSQLIYVDHFGNAVTGIRAQSLEPGAGLVVGGERVRRARVFADVPPDIPFCYENSSGLLEIAVNRGRADRILGLRRGDVVSVEQSC